ncbi:hypothetical protein [Nocardiopsis sp. L17-MgMaSL7]|uniref:hypothetical protein n=1 Tax=Nocardiopsis sp. L17-MgMaSL7 TaxID=1938893 RepID=UPI000D70B803|nr:hypothetical protein [Nocardiopsis sp. L17-MgMaSL7]PWV49978.1 hypothetical protein BDW27_10811 [Nocardiopsis sp. L17-MgMaSL7]
MTTTEMNTMTSLTLASEAAWRPFPTGVVSGIGLSGSTIGGRLRAQNGIHALGMVQLVGSGSVLQGTGVSGSGVVGEPRHESEPALDRGKFTGGVIEASHETPRYGASGECPRKIPA